jgi:hypothetical protein
MPWRAPRRPAKRLERLDLREGKLPNPDVEYPDLGEPAAFATHKAKGTNIARQSMTRHLYNGSTECRSSIHRCRSADDAISAHHGRLDELSIS